MSEPDKSRCGWQENHVSERVSMAKTKVSASTRHERQKDRKRQRAWVWAKMPPSRCSSEDEVVWPTKTLRTLDLTCHYWPRCRHDTGRPWQAVAATEAAASGAPTAKCRIDCCGGCCSHLILSVCQVCLQLHSARTLHAVVW